jgi:hypothetical protein
MARTARRSVKAQRAKPWLNVRFVRAGLRWSVALCVYGLLLALVWACHFRVPPPRLTVDPAAPGAFVAGNAMEHVQYVTRLPDGPVSCLRRSLQHPAASAARANPMTRMRLARVCVSERRRGGGGLRAGS